MLRRYIDIFVRQVSAVEVFQKIRVMAAVKMNVCVGRIFGLRGINEFLQFIWMTIKILPLCLSDESVQCEGYYHK